MNKYWLYLKLRVQSKFSYRLHVFIEFFLRLIPIFIVVYVWKRVTQDYGSVGGYDYEDFVAYYVLVSGVEIFGRSGLLWFIDAGVREGKFTDLFVKPVSVRGLLFAEVWAMLANKLISRLPAFLFLVFIIEPVRTNISLVLWHVPIVMLYLCLYYVFIYFWGLFCGQFIFLFKEMAGISGVYWNVRSVLSGRWIPIDLLPGWISGIMCMTPFANGTFVIVNFIMGRSDLNSLAIGAIKIFVWILIFGVLVKIIWPKIIKNFTGVGI